MKGLRVRNTVTGAAGVVLGAWRNEYSGRVVVNVLPDGARRCDWQMWDAAVTVPVIETEKAA